jgi:hypothetical protein
MADESDLYKQFSDFSYRKILFALMMWEEKKEDEEEEEGRRKEQSVNLIDKRQLIKKFFQEVNDLYPLPKEGATLNSIAIKFYQLKKELLNCDPNWKFMTSDIQYIADILPLLDAIKIGSEKEIPDVTRCVKVCLGLYHNTRRRKKGDPLWNLDVESLVEFLYPHLNESRPKMQVS